MPLSEPITPGIVDWTGENPGILLKNDDGSFSAMALFFRVAWSPVGQGQVLLLYGTPGKAEADPGAPNVLLSDNAALSRYLLDNFIGKLGAFRDSPAFDNLTQVVAQSIRCDGDPMGHRYTESVSGEGYSVELVWEDLEAPRALELTPEQVGTGGHTMFTLLVPAQKAQIIVNGKSLPGVVGTRVQAGVETTSAFLYFSETWVIPARGIGMTVDLHPADRAAFELMQQANPVWDGIESAADAVGLDSNMLLHAGPPFVSVASVSMPILNSACVAAVFEGLANDFEQAATMIRAGEIRLQPAQDHRIVTPLAAVVSASMPLHRVTDATNPALRVYAPLNGGMRPAMRLGLRSEAVLEHIRWLNGPWAELLARGLTRPIEIISIAAGAMREGDDCHGRTPAGTRLMMAQFESGLADGLVDANARDFIDNSPPLFLNLWMAASKCLMQSAAGVAGSSFVTAAAGNGVDTGIQVSGLPGRWFQASATVPQGRFDVDLPIERGLPAIGDSAVVEGLGLGAMALQLSPEQERNFSNFLPVDYRERAHNIMCGSHPGFGDLDCRLGLSARAAAAYGRGPIIGLGILDVEGEKGRLGGGIYDMPAAVFETAVAALGD